MPEPSTGRMDAIPRFAVAPHIRLCRIDDQVIVLDLLNNRYAGVGGATAAALACIAGPSKADQASMFDPDDSDLSALLEPLRARGWLVRASQVSPARGVDANLPEATQTLLAPMSADHSSAGTLRTLRCLRSAVAASWQLKRRSLFATARAIAERKKRLPRGPDDGARDALGEVASAYLRMRPWLFSARDRCLHDSLTLITFLTAEGVFAEWVIGVRIQPFAAHSWVQHEGLVLNDQHERVRAYRPIFVA